MHREAEFDSNLHDVCLTFNMLETTCWEINGKEHETTDEMKIEHRADT